MAFIAPDFPDAFAERLQREFNGRLRIRWSRQRGEWQIEQKVRRAFVEGLRPTKVGWDESVDDYIRYRDGYVLVLSVRTGTNMDCPRCGYELKVPFNVTKVIDCPYCRLRGRRSLIPAMFVPLNETLIQYLRSIDPESEATRRLAEDIDRQNEKLAERMERDALNAGEAAVEQDYRRIVGIPTAYFGRGISKVTSE